MFTETFNFIAGITLFLFTIHYICYIVQTLSLNCSELSATNSTEVKSTRSVAMQSEEAKFIQKY